VGTPIAVRSPHKTQPHYGAMSAIGIAITLAGLSGLAGVIISHIIEA